MRCVSVMRLQASACGALSVCCGHLRSSCIVRCCTKHDGRTVLRCHEAVQIVRLRTTRVFVDAADASSATSREMSTVIVTGATGMLGSRIALQLARKELVASVCCPVRAKRRGGSCVASRVDDIVASWPAADAASVQVKLCLSRVDFAADDAAVVAADAKTPCVGVVHCAALDGYRHPRRLLDRVNVGGTLAAISLACSVGAPLVHMSSCAARLFDLGEDACVAGRGFSTAYAASKAAAERLVLEAIARGELPAGSCAVDIGYLYDDASASGWRESAHVMEFVWRLCHRLAAAPLFDCDSVCVDNTHVDDAAGAIAASLFAEHLAGERSTRSLRFLRHAATAVSWNRGVVPALVEAHAAACGSSGEVSQMQVLPYGEWRTLVLDHCARRGRRLRWISDLMSDDVDSQLRRMFGHRNDRWDDPRATFRAPPIGDRVRQVLSTTTRGR